MVLSTLSRSEVKKEYLEVQRIKISVVIPALNEEKNLPHVLPRLPGIIDEVILVDGHSTDNTIAVARELRPDIVFVKQDGRGKGNALRCGFEKANGDIIVMLDADGSMKPEEIPDFIKPLLNGYDFVKGSRFLSSPNSDDMEWYRKMGNKVFVTLVNRLYGGKYTDLCYGYSAFWRTTIQQMNITSNGFEVETEMNIKALKAGCKVAEVTSYEAERLNGKSNLHTFRDGWRILKTIIRYRFRSNNCSKNNLAGKFQVPSKRMKRRKAIG